MCGVIPYSSPTIWYETLKNNLFTILSPKYIDSEGSYSDKIECITVHPEQFNQRLAIVSKTL